MTDKEKSGSGDHAWGWVITAAVFGCNALCVGYYRAFGVFFVEIIDTFHTSTSLTSLIMGVQAAVLSISALLVHNVLLPVVGERRSALMGGCLMAGGMMLATFATSITFLIFSLSVLVGMGNAMTYGPGLVLLGQYFERRRALAMSVANTGASVGSMTLPLLATHLLTTYGLSGAWLLYGAVTLHLCVFASLYRPLGPHGRRHEEAEDFEEGGSESSQALLKEKGPGEKAEVDLGIEHGHVVCNGSSKIESGCYHAQNGDAKTGSDGLQSNEVCSEKQGPNGIPSSLPQPYVAYLKAEGNTTNFSSAENVSFHKKNVSHNGELHGRRSSTLGDLRFLSPHPHPHHHHYHHNNSNGSINMNAVLQRRLKDLSIHSSHPHLLPLSPSLTSVPRDVEEADSRSVSGDSGDSGESRCHRCRRGCWGHLACDGDLLRKPLFWLVLAYVCVGVVGSTGAGVYLPALCQEKGLDKEQTAVVLTTWGALNLAGRLLCGLLADRQWLRPSHISVISFIVIGVLFQLVVFLPASLGSMVVLAVVYGVFEGAYFTMLPLIIIDFVSLEHFSRTFGFVQLSSGAFSTMSYPLLGQLRDLTGNYYATFSGIGACALLAAGLLLLETGARALKSKRSSDDVDSCQKL